MNNCRLSSQLKNIQIDSYTNWEEQKWHIMPAEGQETVVTIGIGGDIAAELLLKNASKIPPNFFGADPIYQESDKLYETIGTYYPFAVGAQSGLFDTNILLKGIHLLKSFY